MLNFRKTSLRMMNNMIKEEVKVSVVGLDALSWPYLSKLMDKGVIPHIKAVISKSYKYVLKCFPPTTPPSWSSILTGVNPGKHGIFGFDYIVYDSLEQKLYTAMNLEHPRIHEMLSMLNFKSIVINPIPGYPIIPAKGAKILSHTILIPKPQFSPKSMEKYANILAKIIRVEPLRSCSETLNYYDEYLSLLNEIVEKLVYDEWSLFWINLPIPDIILHKCGHYVFSKTLTLEAKVFSKVDKIIKTLSQMSDIISLISDHGFSYYKTLIRINDILAKKGLLKIIGRRKEAALKEYREVKAEFAGKHLEVNRTFVDKFSSKAFYISKWNLGVHVNDFNALPKILELLNSVKGILWAKRRDEVYWGPYVKRAPHIIIRPWFEGGYLQADNKVKGVIYEEGLFKDHHPDGVFTVKTSSLKLLDHIEISNYVVTPLIMCLMNVPLSNITDGIEILEKLFIEEKPKITFKNYIPKWKVLKKLVKVRV